MKKLSILFLVFLIILFVLFLFYKFYFLRLPDRNIPIGDDDIVSPANGKIVSIIIRNTGNIDIEKKWKKALEAYTADVWNSWYLISIMMTPMDVHYQRVSTDAHLIKQEYFAWKFRNAMTEPNKTTYENENNQTLRETESWNRYKIIQIAWKLARRIESFVQVGQKFNKWDVFGIIKLGSKTTIILPDNVKILVHSWDYVTDGESIIWSFVEKNK